MGLERYNNEEGFSLIELVIVIAIMGILITIALEHFMPIIVSARKNIDVSNAKQLVQATTFAIASNEELRYYDGAINISDETKESVEIILEKNLDKIPFIETYKDREFVIHIENNATDVYVTDNYNNRIYPNPSPEYLD